MFVITLCLFLQKVNISHIHNIDKRNGHTHQPAVNMTTSYADDGGLTQEQLTEISLLAPFTEEEKEYLAEGGREIMKAIKIRKYMYSIFLWLLIMDVSFLVFYIIYFVVIEDGAWYNWVELFHFMLELGIVITLFSPDNVHRNLKYLIVLASVALFLDMFGNAYLRPTQWDDANTIDPHKKNIKEILFIFQTFFTIDDFFILIAAVVFAFGAGLEEGVLVRYRQLGYAEDQFLKTAVLYHLSTEAQLKIADDAYQGANRLEEEQKRSVFYTNILAAKTTPSVSSDQRPQPQTQSQPQTQTQTQQQQQPVNSEVAATVATIQTATSGLYKTEDKSKPRLKKPVFENGPSHNKNI